MFTAGVTADLDPPRIGTPGPNPLADMDPPGPNLLADLDQGSKSAVTPAVNTFTWGKERIRKRNLDPQQN